MSGWQTGQIFFRHLLKLTDLPDFHLETIRTLKGWLSLFRKNKPVVIGSRDKLVSIKRKPVNLILDIKSSSNGSTRYLDTPSTTNPSNQIRLIINE